MKDNKIEYSIKANFYTDEGKKKTVALGTSGVAYSQEELDSNIRKDLDELEKLTNCGPLPFTGLDLSLIPSYKGDVVTKPFIYTK